MSKYTVIPLLVILSTPTILSLIAFALSKSAIVVNTALTQLFGFANYFTAFLPSVHDFFARVSSLWDETHWSVAVLSGLLALVMYL